MLRKCNKAVLFTIFKRQDTTEKVFEVIRKVQPPRLYIAADGPRKDVKDEIEKCIKTREIIKKIDWDCEVKTLFRENNLGCAVAMSEAISWFFDTEEDGIILEDDCLPSESFFYYCEELLNYYKDNEKIMSICGCHIGNPYNEFSYYFSHFFDPWGWATWKRAWKYFDLYLEKYNYEDFSNTIDKIYTSDIKYLYLKKSAKELFEIYSDINVSKNNTWDYPWIVCILANSGICIYPNVNLITNIGFGEDSVHCFNKDNPLANMKNYDIEKISHTPNVTISLENEEDRFIQRFSGMTLEDYIKHLEDYIKHLEEQNLKLKNDFKYYIDKIAWWIPVRKWRDNFRAKFQ